MTAGHLALASGLEDLHTARRDTDVSVTEVSTEQNEQVRSLKVIPSLGIHGREGIARRFNQPGVAVSRRL
jgi:hypothetical protein